MTLQYGSGGDNRFGDHVGTIHGMTFFHGAARYLMDGRFECSDDQCGERTILFVPLYGSYEYYLPFTMFVVCCLLVVFQMACEVSQRYVPVNDSDVKKIDR